MNLLTSVKKLHNSKLYFSRNELSKILACYSLGVSRGSWKDYAISFGKQTTSFYMFKHSLAAPDCILTKSQKQKKNFIFYDLELSNKQKSKFSEIDDLIAIIRRKEFKIL
jgi:hypothetical protein